MLVLAIRNLVSRALSSFSTILVVFVVTKQSHLAQAGLELKTKLRMPLNFWSCCLHFPSVVITDTHFHTQLHSWSLTVCFLDLQFVPGSLFKAVLFSSSRFNLSETSLKIFFLLPRFFLLMKSFFPSIL